jgi:hypothetical protein
MPDAVWDAADDASDDRDEEGVRLLGCGCFEEALLGCCAKYEALPVE